MIDRAQIESKLQQAELELGKARDAVKTFSRRALDHRNQLAASQKSLESLQAQIRSMKAPGIVASMKEFQRVSNERAILQGSMETRKSDVKRLESQLNELQKAIPLFEKAVEEVKQALRAYGNVLEFPTNEQH